MDSLGVFRDESVRQSLRKLYSEWCKKNITYWNTYISIIAVLSMVILVPFDLVLFKGYFYPVARSIIIGLVASVYMLSQTKVVAKYSNSAEVSIFFTVSLLLYAYVFFLIRANDQERVIVLVGTALVTIFTNVALYRFWRPQMIFSIQAVVLFLACSALLKGRYDFILLVISDLIATLFAVLFRRVFASSLVEKFLLTRAMVPEQIANFITTSGHHEYLESAFPLRNRLVSCVCCDWRGYQELAAKLSPMVLSQLQEKFYDLVFEALRIVDPAGCYFANWTADELFVVFYDIQNDISVADKAMKLSLELQGHIFDKFNREADVSIMYDIGLSIGTGVLGLQGPKLYKKTTITGAVAGFAKRFETEAKIIRRKLKRSSPIIVTSSEFLLNCSPNLSGRTLVQDRASSKDIDGIHISIILRLENSEVISA